MIERTHVVIGLVSIGAISILSALLTWQCLRRKRRNEAASRKKITRTDSMNERLQSGIAKLRQEDSKSHYKSRRRGLAGNPLFTWSDHPSLVTDAVEHGWSRFAFTPHQSPSSPSPGSLLGMCAVGGDFRRQSESPEMSWEISPESADFMQKIRLNPGLAKPPNANSVASWASSVVRTGLPLPGPVLGKVSPFPQEAYFEIAVLSCHVSGDEAEESGDKVKEGERTKLIRENDSVRFGDKVAEDLKVRGDDGKNGGGGGGGGGRCVMFSVGLTAGGSLPLRLPGSYPGSIGFNSDGSLYVDGIKLAFASEKAEWERTEKVIGCGFDPKQKKVFFTVDSEVIHVVHCKSEEFGTPLYPTLAANGDVLVIVNLGQSAFKYAPANSRRTPNPCFVGPTADSPAATIGYEDSKELFSMGRIDAQWLNRCTARGGQNPGNLGSLGNQNQNRVLDFDEESEADLFEIVLDSCGRSPNAVS